MIQGTAGEYSDPWLSYTVSPTGGIIALEPGSATDFGSWSLTRYISVSGQSVSGVTLFEGQTGVSPITMWVDIGDGANAPLDPTMEYVYRFTTASGTAETPALSPACSISLEPDEISSILYRALQSGISALKLPAAFQNKPKVVHAMPLAGAGTPTLPTIAFNETLLQQEEIRIGQDVDDDYQANEFQVAAQAVRHYTIFVMASNAREREYYKDAVIAIFNSMLGPILNKLGTNIRHKFQATGSQITGRANEPGFYFSEILLQFSGLYCVGVKTNYGVIEHIDPEPTEVEVDYMIG